MEVLNFRDTIDRPNVVAEFDIYLPAVGLTMYNFRLVKSKSGKLFVNPPSYMKEIAGQKKFFPYFTISPERKKFFDEELDRLLKPFFDKGSGPAF